jgi:hypothetical protein
MSHPTTEIIFPLVVGLYLLLFVGILLRVRRQNRRVRGHGEDLRAPITPKPETLNSASNSTSPPLRTAEQSDTVSDTQTATSSTGLHPCTTENAPSTTAPPAKGSRSTPRSRPQRHSSQARQAPTGCTPPNAEGNLPEQAALLDSDRFHRWTTEIEQNGSPCHCGGGLPECSFCGGTGWLEAEQTSRK